MNGILVVNKPINYTSRDVVNILNKIFNTKKIGHAGTLDPFASGVLVICIGKYTKLVEELTNFDKEYTSEVILGIKTDTLDITGSVLEEKKVQKLNKEDVIDALKFFEKKYSQTVPLYSAVKIKGKKLYEYARRKEKITQPKRMVTIYKNELIEINDAGFIFHSKVSKGTYIRALADDILTKLNAVGTLKNLTRTKQGNLSIKNSYTLDEIKNNKYKILKASNVLSYEGIEITSEEYKMVTSGAKIFKNIKPGKYILKYKEEDIAIYDFSENVGVIKTLLI